MEMFKKILIANRGEIALRIIRACREMGIQTAIAYSKADENSLPVRLADQAVCIGPASAQDSYLLSDRIISVAEICNADAIHPGYGFLAENIAFAEICRSCKITFIGPTPEQMKAMGDKANAKETMRKAKVPVTPGSNGIIETEEAALRIAKKLGYPVIIKATAGGGGRGMRIAHDDATLVDGFHSAHAEAEKAFGNGEVYIEKYVANPRHIEVQILADNFGNIVSLGERDCSLQRRHQKLMEESPSPSLSSSLRRKINEAAIRAAKAVKYVNAGTVEFLLAPDGEFYFMEMNTRVQVEHPVTEMVTGIDIIKEQIRIAAGMKLSIQQKNIVSNGHAIECRINAENPFRGFAPCPGKISLCYTPGGPGVRVDSHAYSGYTISPAYDSMIGKLIVWGENRDQAIARCRRALDEYVVEGISTTIPFEQYMLSLEEFQKGSYDTSLIERVLQSDAYRAFAEKHGK